MDSGERHFFQAAKLCAAFRWQLDKKKHVCYNEEQNKTPFRSTALRKVV